MLTNDEILNIVANTLKNKIEKIAWEKFLLDYPEIKMTVFSYNLPDLSYYRIKVGDTEINVPEKFNNILKEYYARELFSLLE